MRPEALQAALGTAGHHVWVWGRSPQTPLAEETQQPDKLQFACHQTSNPAYFSTSSEKMEFAQANHSRLKFCWLLASMLSCMK